MKVRNMVNSKGNTIANQFIIEDGNLVVFQSYNSKIIEFNSATRLMKVYPDWDYSKTTLKYLKQFIEENTCYSYGSKKLFENNKNNPMVTFK